MRLMATVLQYILFEFIKKQKTKNQTRNAKLCSRPDPSVNTGHTIRCWRAAIFRFTIFFFFCWHYYFVWQINHVFFRAVQISNTTTKKKHTNLLKPTKYSNPRFVLKIRELCHFLSFVRIIIIFG